MRIEKTFQDIQSLFIPDPMAPFNLYTDACLTGFGASLLQNGKVARVFSRRFSTSELNYTIVEKECYAIIRGLKIFRPLIGSNKVVVHIDNKNLTFDTATSSSRAQKWKILLNEFNVEVIHVAGRDNAGSDFLSRSFSATTVYLFIDAL